MKNLYILIAMAICFSCTDDFLEQKSNQKLLIPNTIEDFQLILDNSLIMNNSPSLGFIASDDFQLTDNAFYNEGLGDNEKAAYLRDFSLMAPIYNGDWATCYKKIFYSNIVLDGLENINNENSKVQEIRASALFYRSYAFFCLLQTFAKPFTKDFAKTDLSVPMALSSDLNAERSVVTLQAAYDQIIGDLEYAARSLPDRPLYALQPSKLAALSLLGRIYLLMGEYSVAEEKLANAMKISSELMNYNEFDPKAKRPFPSIYPDGPGNIEVVFYSPFNSYLPISVTREFVSVNPILVKKYADNDLRKDLYFDIRTDGTAGFKGSYAGSRRSGSVFSGLSIDENYLNYAEVLARNNKIESSQKIINKLLSTRFKTGEYVEYKSSDASATLNFILEEREKSLVGKGTRWYDIRRFINDKAFFIAGTRMLDNKPLEFKMGDQRLVFPFPINEN